MPGAVNGGNASGTAMPRDALWGRLPYLVPTSRGAAVSPAHHDTRGSSYVGVVVNTKGSNPECTRSASTSHTCEESTDARLPEELRRVVPQAIRARKLPCNGPIPSVFSRGKYSLELIYQVSIPPSDLCMLSQLLQKKPKGISMFENHTDRPPVSSHLMPLCVSTRPHGRAYGTPELGPHATSVASFFPAAPGWPPKPPWGD